MGCGRAAVGRSATTDGFEGSPVVYAGARGCSLRGPSDMPADSSTTSGAYRLWLGRPLNRRVSAQSGARQGILELDLVLLRFYKRGYESVARSAVAGRFGLTHDSTRLHSCTRHASTFMDVVECRPYALTPLSRQLSRMVL